MQINPYLFFNGNCEAAMTRYAQVLGGEIDKFVSPLVQQRMMEKVRSLGRE